MSNNTIDSAQDAAADISHTVRDATRKTTQRVSDAASDLAGSASEFFQGDRMKALGEEVRNYVKASPVVAIVGAIVVGIVVGRLSARD